MCGPVTATIVDFDVFDQANQKLGGGDSIEWYFTLGDMAVTVNPRGGCGRWPGRQDSDARSRPLSEVE